MSALDTLKARVELKWFDSNALGKVYYKPMTLWEQDKIGLGDDKIKLANKLSAVVIMKALDANGERLFKDTDADELKKLCEGEDVAEIANGIIQSKSVEEQLGE